MKNALSLACMLLAGILLSTSGFAQSNTLFNPDYNGDGFIGVDDILGALSVYDNAWEGPVFTVYYGCTYPMFLEYDALATLDDGSCETRMVSGCTDSSYLEYNASANADDGSCVTLEVLGCIDSFYLEYDASANVNDGSCYTLGVPGCTNTSYLEYDASATVDDGSCLTTFEGCGNSMSYQGYDYTTVMIGEQCWFSENLRSQNYKNGDPIPSNLSEDAWQDCPTGAVSIFGEGNSYCYTENLESNACDESWSLNEFGRLYNGKAVVDFRGLCPSGWHVPSALDFNQLIDNLGGEELAGGQMKTEYGWYNDGDGTNSSGFSGLPGGRREFYGGFTTATVYGYWWTSSYYSGGLSYLRLESDSEEADLSGANISTGGIGHSVRCVLDENF